MKGIINGKSYSTETAKFIANYSYGWSNDFNYVDEDLYLKKTGEFFIAGEGGANTGYAVSAGNNSYCGSERITPLTIEEAKDWLERHGTFEDYVEAFGEPEE